MQFYGANLVCHPMSFKHKSTDNTRMHLSLCLTKNSCVVLLFKQQNPGLVCNNSGNFQTDKPRTPFFGTEISGAVFVDIRECQHIALSSTAIRSQLRFAVLIWKMTLADCCLCAGGSHLRPLIIKTNSTLKMKKKTAKKRKNKSST